MKKHALFTLLASMSLLSAGVTHAQSEATKMTSQTIDLSVNVTDPSMLALNWEAPEINPVANSAIHQEVGTLNITASGASYVVLHDDARLKNGALSFAYQGQSESSRNQIILAQAYVDGEVLTPYEDGLKVTLSNTGTHSVDITFKTAGTLKSYLAGRYTDSVTVDAYAS